MSNDNEITYEGGMLHPGQVRIAANAMTSEAMYHTIVCPRQWGKSFFGIQLLLWYGINFEESNIMFTSPVYSQANKVFKEFLKGVRDTGVVKKFNASENSVILVNGSEIFFKSVQVADNLRGYSIDFMVCDEFALYKLGVFESVLRPMLNVRGKKCFLMSTPKGKNLFYNMYQKGKSGNPRYESYFGTYADNPYANLEEIEDARKSIPERLFRQEYRAEFVEDGGEVFDNVFKCATVTEYSAPVAGETYYAGVDLGRQDDYSVITVLNSKGDVATIFRINKADWTRIIDGMAQVLKIYNPRHTLVEVNGIGDVVFSMLLKKHANISPWVTSNESKQEIIEELILTLQDEKIGLPDSTLCPELHDEMADFTFEYSKKSRRIFYQARTGHDDMVVSLALAQKARKSGVGKGIYAVY